MTQSMSAAEVLSNRRSWAILHGDALATLRGLPNGCIDLVVTSPPYNMGASPSAWAHPNGIRGVALDWQGYQGSEDAMPETEYQEWQIAVLGELYRALKDGRSLMYVHQDRTWEGRSISPLEWLHKTPFFVRQQIVWDQTRTHQHNGHYFPQTNEWVFWLTKGIATKRPGQIAHAWGSVWHIAPTKLPWHPAPFPVPLAARCIAALTDPGEIVLDPFSGAGSTGLAAIQNERRYIGIEQSEDYVTRSRVRLSQLALPLFNALGMAV